MKSRLGTLKPQLAIHYERASEGLYGEPVYVTPDKYDLFAKAEARLRKEGIYPKDYAHKITNGFQSWIDKNNWDYLPINVFCGDYAINVYIKHYGNDHYVHSPDTDIDEGVLLDEELKIARYYIQNNNEEGFKTFGQAVKELKPVLSKQWLDLYQGNKRAKLISRALDMLSEENGRHISNYDDLVL